MEERFGIMYNLFVTLQNGQNYTFLRAALGRNVEERT